MNSLQQLRQHSSESIDNLHMRVREKIAFLDMERLSVTEIIELITLSQLVNHCTRRALRTKALTDGLSLKDFLKNARAYERAEQQTEEIASGNTK
jgi:hypothetical protein